MGKRRKMKRLRKKMLLSGDIPPKVAEQISLSHTSRAYEITRTCCVDADCEDKAARKIATVLASIDEQSPGDDYADAGFSSTYLRGNW
jgi:hypothetical protein